MLKIGLTGIICSGKSTVAKKLKEMDIPVVSTDQLVRSFHKPGNVLWQEIKQRWGEKYILEDCELDRKKMAADLIEDQDFRMELEEMTHPLVRQEVTKIFNIWREEGRQTAVAEAPLLFEAGWECLFDKIVLAYAPESTLLKRIMKKREVNKKIARKWLELHESQEEKREKVDYIIETEGSIEDTGEKVKKIINIIKET